MPSAHYRSVFAPGLFAGQVIVVTGGGSGIGRCTAHELAALGAQVVLLGRKLDKLQHVASEIIADGGRCTFHSCDIRNEAAVQDVVQAIVVAQGRIHGLECGYVADCAIIPRVPRANTNIPAVLVGERLVTWL